MKIGPPPYSTFWNICNCLICGPAVDFPTMWTSCCCQYCADLEDTVKVALRQGTVPMPCWLQIAMCHVDCRCTSCAGGWLTQPVPAEHNNCSLLSAHCWWALFETCSQVDIFIVNTTSMGIFSPAPAEEFPSPMPSLPSLEWDYFLLGLLCKLRRVTLGRCQTTDEISLACCAKIFSKMRSLIITCRVVLTVPPDFLEKWALGDCNLFLILVLKLGGELEKHPDIVKLSCYKFTTCCQK